MAADALAVAVPHDPLLSVTWTGDVFVNSSARLTSSSFYPVFLHEVGHVLGLDESADPKSVMYPILGAPRPLSVQDLAQVRSLYGLRAPGVWEGNKGNQTLANATRIKVSDLSDPYDGTTPLITFGDITPTRDVDTYLLRPLDHYSGPVTFRLQTAGLSLLAPALTVMDQKGRVLGRASSTDPLGGTVTIRLSQVAPGTKYFLRVEVAVKDVFGIGRYALVVTFDSVVLTTPQQLETFLLAVPSSLAQYRDDSIDDLTHAEVEPDEGTNDLELNATKPPAIPTPVPARLTRFEAVGSLESATDVDVYRIRAPKAATKGQTLVLVASLNTLSLDGVLPEVTLLDGNLAPLATETLVNTNGTLTVQTRGIVPGKDVYLRVGSASGKLGNYLLQAYYGDRALEAKPIAVASVGPAEATQNYRAFLGHSQLTQFTVGQFRVGGDGGGGPTRFPGCPGRDGPYPIGRGRPDCHGRHPDVAARHVERDGDPGPRARRRAGGVEFPGSGIEPVQTDRACRCEPPVDAAVCLPE